MDRFIFLAFLVGAVNEVTSLSAPRGYYWRDFEGDIPTDALPGSTLRNETVYIGQAVHWGKMIPGKINTQTKTLPYEWGNNEETTARFKILCSNEPENFEWIASSIWEFKTLGNKPFVIGGFEENYKTLIGRTREGGEILIGKLLIKQSNWETLLHVTTSDHKVTRHEQYEVLVYNKAARVSSCKRVVVNVYNQC